MNALKISRISLLLISTLLLFSCQKNFLVIEGEGGIETEVLHLNDFDGIIVNDAINVVIKQDSVQYVEVVGHENIIDRLKTNVVGGTWKVDLQRGIYTNYQLTVYIYVPEINYIGISGSGDVEVDDFYNQQYLDVDISGSGRVELNEFHGCERFDATISGSGEIIVRDMFYGLERTDIRISGSGTFDAFPMETEECDIDISGSGDCYVNVEDYLDVHISGSGDVYYIGYPDIHTNISGSGSVINDN